VKDRAASVWRSEILRVFFSMGEVVLR